IIRDWYNGYSFGGHTIYNPWSVISYIQAIPNPPGPKWLNTSSNALVYEELEAGGLEIKRDLEVLLAGEELRYPISENIIFTDIGRNPVNIWSLLYYSGYLNAEDPQPDLRGRLRYRLRIPNREISYAYEHFIESLYRNTDGGLDLLLHCFLGKRPILQIGPVLQDLTRDLVSMYDLAKLPEAVFHAFVLGLLANLRTVYEIRSNAEAGFGRADILMIPKTRDYPTAYVIEFKTTDGQQNTEIVSDALNQIRNQEYEAALSNAGISDEQIVRLAIILQGKEVRVATGYYAGVMNVQPKRRYVL
ncbi:PD-(D/E)XK nuclease domain-containing protein, partial [Methanospirillum hungatei]